MPGTREQFSRRIKTVFGRETKFNGKLFFTESLKISGTFNGVVESQGFLLVDTDAVVTANIRAGTLVVCGKIKGNVQVEKRLEILSGGQIIGDISCPNLIIADGTSIQGQCEMLEDPNSIDIFSMPADRLKKSVNRVE